jgi:hypothetical protein
MLVNSEGDEVDTEEHLDVEVVEAIAIAHTAEEDLTVIMELELG